MAFPAASVAAAALEFIKTTSQAHAHGSSFSSGRVAIPDDFHHLIGGNNLDGVVSNCYHSMSLGAATSVQRTTSLPGQIAASPCPSRTNSPPPEQFEASGGPAISANGIVKRDFDEATDRDDGLTAGAFPGGFIHGQAAVVDNYLDNFQSNFPSLDAFLGELNAVDRDRDQDQRHAGDGSGSVGSTCLRDSASGLRTSKSNSGGGLRSSDFTIESIMRK